MVLDIDEEVKRLMRDRRDNKLSKEEFDSMVENLFDRCKLKKVQENERYDIFNKILEKDRYTVAKATDEQFLIVGEPGLHKAMLSYTDNYTNEHFHVVKLKVGKGLEERTDHVAVKDIRKGWVHERIHYMPAEIARRVIDRCYP